MLGPEAVHLGEATRQRTGGKGAVTGSVGSIVRAARVVLFMSVENVLYDFETAVSRIVHIVALNSN